VCRFILMKTWENLAWENSCPLKVILSEEKKHLWRPINFPSYETNSVKSSLWISDNYFLAKIFPPLSNYLLDLHWQKLNLILGVEKVKLFKRTETSSSMKNWVAPSKCQGSMVLFGIFLKTFSKCCPYGQPLFNKTFCRWLQSGAVNEIKALKNYQTPSMSNIAGEKTWRS